MAAESRAASVVDVEVQEGSWVLQNPDMHATLEERSATLVVGYWRKGAEHPTTWDRANRLEAGDRLIALGTPLQVERLRALLGKSTS